MARYIGELPLEDWELEEFDVVCADIACSIGLPRRYEGLIARFLDEADGDVLAASRIWAKYVVARANELRWTRDPTAMSEAPLVESTLV